MSTNPSRSEDARGRVSDLRGNVLDRLQAHAPLVGRLEQAENVADGTDVIVPDPVLDRQHRASDGDPPDVAVAIMVVTGSSTPENLQERVSLVVQAKVQAREQALDRQGLAWLDRLLDECSAVLTRHDDGLTARGADGGTPSPIWNDQINRYELVGRYTVESWG